MGAELAEAPAELFGGAEKAVAKHEWLSRATDEIAESLAADGEKSLIHHVQTLPSRRDDAGDKCASSVVAVHQRHH